MDGNEILDIEFFAYDLDRQLTVRGYLQALLLTLLREGESFSGKRPFGNSGWEYDLIKPLIEAGAIDGELDEDGYPETFVEAEFQIAISEAIEAL